MSTYPNSQQTLMAQNPTNGLAIAGFVCSLLGLFTGGLPSPVGLILSAVGLGKPGNRALAGWGVALGIVGLCGWIIAAVIAIIAIPVVLLAMVGIGLYALANPVKAEVTADMAIVAASIHESREDTGYLPADLSTLNLDPGFLNDPWGNAYTYRLTDENERGYELTSAGADGQIVNDDDITLTNLGDLWNEGGLVEVTTTEGADGDHVRVRIGDRTIEVDEDQDGARVEVGGEEYEVDDNEAQNTSDE